MSVGDYRYVIDQRVDVRWDDDKLRELCFSHFNFRQWSDPENPRSHQWERSRGVGVLHPLWWLYYLFIRNIFIDDKRMEGWVPARKISLYNKKSSKRPREIESCFSEKVIDWLIVLFCRKPRANRLSSKRIMPSWRKWFLLFTYKT